MSLIQFHLSKKEINTQSNCFSTTPLPNYNKITTHIVYKSHNFGLCSLGEHTFWTLDMMMRRQPSSGIQPFNSPFWGLCILSMKQHQLFLSPDCHTFDLFLNLYNTVDSHYYVDSLLRYICYYVGNLKHKTISYINLYKIFPLLLCPKMQNPSITM